MDFPPDDLQKVVATWRASRRRPNELRRLPIERTGLGPRSRSGAAINVLPSSRRPGRAARVVPICGVRARRGALADEELLRIEVPDVHLRTGGRRQGRRGPDRPQERWPPARPLLSRALGQATPS